MARERRTTKEKLKALLRNLIAQNRLDELNQEVLHEFKFDTASTVTRDLGQNTDSTEWSNRVELEQIPGKKPSLIFLYTGTLGLNGQKYKEKYEEHECPPGCLEVYFSGKTRILVIYSRIDN